MNTSIAPWNETFLGTSGAWPWGEGWQNGSLASQIKQENASCSSYWTSTFCDYYFNSLYPVTNNTPYPRLEVFANNLASITFNVTSYYYDSVFPLAEAIFDDGMMRTTVGCIYPISGQYDFLSRLLFYMLIVVSLLFRRHNWLATAALGTAMTYAFTAAVHMLILVVNFQFGTSENLVNYNPNTSKPYGDTDIFGIYPILAAAAIMITPILNWSVSIRNSNAQPVVIWWAVLILSALIPAWLYFSPAKDGDVSWWNNQAISFALCPRSASRPECVDDMELDDDSYYYCQCMDFCSTFSPSDVPLRKGANLVPWLSRKASERTISNPHFLGVVQFNKFVLVFVLIQGFLGVLQSQFTQQEVRNLIFRFLYLAPKDFVVLFLQGERKRRWLTKLKLGPAEQDTDKNTIGWRIRLEFARLVAGGSFVLAVIFAVISPAIFVTTAVANELYIGYYPISEQSDAVGAWASWVATGAVVVAGSLIRYRESWESTLKLLIYKICLWLIYDEHERPSVEQYRNREGSQVTKSDPDKVNAALQKRKKSFILEMLSPLRHSWHSLIRAWWRSSTELAMFRDWWMNPEVESKRNWAALTQEVERRMLKCPPCICHFCARHSEDDKEAPFKYTGTWGQELVSELETLYSLHKSGIEPLHSSYGYKRSLQSNLSEGSTSIYDLPEIPPSAPISMDEVDAEQYPFETRHPIEPQPIAYSRTHVGYEDLSQSRRGFKRQNSEPFEITPTISEFHMPRKHVGFESPSTSEHQELLSSKSPEVHQEDRFGP